MPKKTQPKKPDYLSKLERGWLKDLCKIWLNQQRSLSRRLNAGRMSTETRRWAMAYARRNQLRACRKQLAYYLNYGKPA